MKELPRPALIMFLLIGFVLITMVVVQVYRGSNQTTTEQRLDQLDLQTDNPQPAGKNVAP